jgi:hypothetical protein
VFAALAEFIRVLINRAPTRAWTLPVPAVRLGCPPAMTEEQGRHARDLLARPENTVTSIAKLLGVLQEQDLQLRDQDEGRSPGTR